MSGGYHTYTSEEYEKLFLEGQRQKGQIAALEEENSRLKSELASEQRARSKSVRAATSLLVCCCLQSP